MTTAVFDKAMISILTKTVNITAASNTTYCVLSGSTEPTKATFQTYNDVKQSLGTFEITGTGYTVGGGQITTIVPTTTLGVTGVKANPSSPTTAWGTNATFSCNYAIIQNCITAGAPTATGNPLLCYIDVGAQTVSAGSLTFTWNPAGIMTLTT
jgi:hypothetical protein